MKPRRLYLLALLLFLLIKVPASSAQIPPLNLDFEKPLNSGGPHCWGGTGTGVTRDGIQKHGGLYSVRLDRDDHSSGQFSAVNSSFGINFKGSVLTLRGFLRTEKVSNFAGLWLRVDGPEGTLEIDNMARQRLNGTSPWRQYQVQVHLKPSAQRVAFGALISGTGSLWADDLEILLDGAPLVPELTVLDTDQEFTSHSGVADSNLSGAQVDNLVLLGKVWGFLKYYHPAITSGQHHWDFDLFRFLPGYLQLDGPQAARQALVTWVDSLGSFPLEETSLPEDKGLALAADLDWIRDIDQLGPALSERLQNIALPSEAKGQQFYVAVPTMVGNPDFSRELPYLKMLNPDAGYRLLALYRYWNIIEYWYPNRDIIGENWDGVLREFIPRLLAAGTNDQYRMELMALIARVHDTHANLWSDWKKIPPRGDYYLPFALRFLKGQAVVSHVFPDLAGKKLDLMPGDVVTAMDGRPVADLIREREPWYAASNQPTRLRDMARIFLRGPEESSSLIIARAGQSREVAVSRVSLDFRELVKRSSHHRPGPAFQRLSPEIAYLKFSDVSNDSIDSYLAQAAGSRGWVLDLRNYPSAFLVFSLGGHLVADPTPFVRFTTCDLAHPGAFHWSEPLSLPVLSPQYQGKVVILVDETTQSSAEYHAMAFRAVPGAKVLGSTTAGADGNVSTIMLPGGARTMISGIGIFYPDKRPTQCVGIVPDQEVIPTPQGLRDDRDEVLEAAARLILDRPVSSLEIKELLKFRE